MVEILGVTNPLQVSPLFNCASIFHSRLICLGLFLVKASLKVNSDLNIPSTSTTLLLSQDAIAGYGAKDRAASFKYDPGQEF